MRLEAITHHASHRTQRQFPPEPHISTCLEEVGLHCTVERSGILCREGTWAGQLCDWNEAGIYDRRH